MAPRTWNNSLTGYSFFSRINAVIHLVPPKYRAQPYFSPQSDYRRSFKMLLHFEAVKRQKGDKPTYEAQGGFKLYPQDRVKVLAGHYGAVQELKDGLVGVSFDREPDDIYYFQSSDLVLVDQAPADPTLTLLYKQRERNAQIAANAPSVGWIETGKVKNRNFVQAWWKGNFASGRKTIYIGSVKSPAYAQAREAQAARKKVKQIDKEIKELKRASNLQRASKRGARPRTCTMETPASQSSTGL